MKICIITPCGNEDDSIAAHIDELKFYLSKVDGHNFKIIFIVDGFTSEETLRILNQYSSAKDSIIQVIKKPDNRHGLAGCYIAGYEYFADNEFDYVLEMDVGHPCKFIQSFIDGAEKGFDIVLGSRNMNKGKNLASFKRRLVSGLGNFLCRNFLSLNLTDCTSGFQLYSKDVINFLNFNNFVSTSYFFQTELKVRSVNSVSKEYCKDDLINNRLRRFILLFDLKKCKRWRTIEIPFVYENSNSSINLKKVIESFFEFLKLRRIVKRLYRSGNVARYKKNFK